MNRFRQLLSEVLFVLISPHWHFFQLYSDDWLKPHWYGSSSDDDLFVIYLWQWHFVFKRKSQ
jgi:hypothetical protein